MLRDTYPNSPELFQEKAELLKALAHPVRLCIVKLLMELGSANVTHLQSCSQAPQSTISQHLGKLRTAKILEARRQGPEIYYTLVNEDAKRIVSILFPNSKIFNEGGKP
ncbi:MAG: hypothetical protein PWQ91_519 [Eubacteriales bacterium]|nr:hypothetical protein [Eubacteriales bacterium]